ncbi:MAG: sensor histidine kinase [Bacteroidia bacterium]
MLVVFLFTSWVIYLSFKSVSIREDIKLKVGAISDLSTVDNLITKSNQTTNYQLPEKTYQTLKKGIDLSKPEINLELYNGLNQWISSPQAFENKLELQQQIKAEVRVLRIALSQLSVHLESMWVKITYAGMFSCFFAILSALLFYLSLKSRAQLELANLQLNKKNNELAIKSKELTDSNQTKDKLFAIIGHDLRGPVDTLKLFFDQLNRNKITEADFNDFKKGLKEHVDKVHFTLNNLLKWAIEQMDGGETIKKEFIIYHSLRDSFALLNDFAKSKEITVNINFDKFATVLADEEQIKLVFRNLLSNALKYTSRHGIINIHSYDRNDFLIISIEDNGKGIDNNLISRILEKKPQNSKIGTKGEKGTGIGLMLSKEFIEKNGGELWVESEKGSGSIFYFSIPRAN